MPELDFEAQPILVNRVPSALNNYLLNCPGGTRRFLYSDFEHLHPDFERHSEVIWRESAGRRMFMLPGESGLVIDMMNRGHTAKYAAGTMREFFEAIDTAILETRLDINALHDANLEALRTGRGIGQLTIDWHLRLVPSYMILRNAGYSHYDLTK